MNEQFKYDDNVVGTVNIRIDIAIVICSYPPAA